MVEGEAALRRVPPVRSYARSPRVGRRPTVIQIPSWSVTLAIQPSVVEGSYPVAFAPCFSSRRYVRSSVLREATPR
jgi:hypothetical protein